MSDTKLRVAMVDFAYNFPWYYVPPAGGAYVGVGSTPAEAADDCLESIYQAGFEIDEADAQAIIDAAMEYSAEAAECDEEDPCMDGPWWYCAVQVADEE
jgi:hypothetical protein